MMHPPRTAEMTYVRALRSIMMQLHAEYMRRLQLRQDALTEHSATLDELAAISLVPLRTAVGRSYGRMATLVAKNNENGLRTVVKGIRISDARLGGHISAARDANIQLMENAHRSYAAKVREILEDPANVNRPVKDLAKDIEKEANVSANRAELIARDQTLKLNSNITKIRCQNAGLTKYKWNTSHDERVRDSHAAIDGQTFDFATGAPSLDGLNPGEDFQCRCASIPIFDEPDAEI